MTVKRTPHKYTEEQESFLLSLRLEGYSSGQIANEFNEKFHTSITQSAAMHKARRLQELMDSSLQTTKTSRIRYTKEMENYIKEIFLEGYYFKDMVLLFEKRYGMKVSQTSLEHKVRRLHLPKREITKYRTGMIPKNKGKRMTPEQRTRRRLDYARKGMSHRNQELFTTKIDKQGCLWIKVQDGHGVKNWKQKHRYIWEQHHGPIPKGMLIIFADNDYSNCDISNLRMISRKTHMVMNAKKLRITDANYIDISISTAELIMAINKSKSDCQTTWPFRY